MKPTPVPRREPIVVYRLWCGRRKHSGWKTSLREVWRIALRKRLAFKSIDGRSPGLGPLTWIEKGERRYARSRTRSLGRHAG